jgi:hypothetical protein
MLTEGKSELAGTHASHPSSFAFTGAFARIIQVVRPSRWVSRIGVVVGGWSWIVTSLGRTSARISF